MYIVRQYYIQKGEVATHPFSVSESYEEAFESMNRTYEKFKGCFVIILGLEEEQLKELTLKLKAEGNEKGYKSILTIYKK